MTDKHPIIDNCITEYEQCKWGIRYDKRNAIKIV